ncbi:MAG: uncharacterized protein PWQ10_516 [Patescibacteria group bacterium]|nr:uncharacterized protein [Patescibacteria group bacterium]
MESHKRMGVILIISGILIAVFLSFFFIFLPIITKPKVSLWLGDSLFSADVVIDETGRNKGLSGVTKVDPNAALLMVFPHESKWGIWMKDMKIPIDIVWLDKNKKVIYIEKNVSPSVSDSEIFEPKSLAKYVIEIPAGMVDKSAIRVGRVAIFQINEEGVE